jgi:hypothetical protein
MIGRNPLWVPKQHGYSLLRRLDGGGDAAAIREALGYVDRKLAAPADGSLRTHLAVDLPVARRPIQVSTASDEENDGG